LNSYDKEIRRKGVRIRTLYPPKLKEKKALRKNSYKNIEGYVFDGFLKILNVTDSIYSKDLIKDNKIYYYQKTPFTGVSITNNENNKKTLEEIFLKGFLFKSILVELGLNTERSKQTYYYKSGNIRSESVFVDEGGGAREYSAINFSENGYRINSSSERVKEGDTYADEYIEYYDNGNIKSEGILNYESSEYVEYYKNGQIKKRQQYQNELQLLIKMEKNYTCCY